MLSGCGKPVGADILCAVEQGSTPLLHPCSCSTVGWHTRKAQVSDFAHFTKTLPNEGTVCVKHAPLARSIVKMLLKLMRLRITGRAKSDCWKDIRDY